MERGKAQRETLMQRQIRPERILAVGFLTLILLGTALLCLPIATYDGRGLSVFDSLFTATSAVCVTGLVAVDTGTTFSGFGQAVLLFLIEVGGLGFMVFATLVMGLLGRRLSLKNRVLIRDSMSGTTLSGLVQLTWIYFAIALVIELLGAALLSIRFIPRYGAGRGLWLAVFHAISAFCNAGFDLFGHFGSLTAFANDPLVLLTVSMLIMLGSMGFLVIFEVIRSRGSWKALSLHSRVALCATGVLLVGGTAFYALAEWNNPGTLGAEGMGVGGKLMGAFFQSVTMRTAGFNSVNLAELTDASKLVSVMLMFIGASPASTGGGVKTTTVAMLFFVVMSVVRGDTEVNVMKKRLPPELTRRALAIVTINLLLMLLCTLGLAWAEHDGVPFIDLLFESASAMATVGVSAVGTPALHPLSRALIIPIMYFGRVGPLTLALAFANKQNGMQNRVRYPEDKILLG